MIRHGTFLIAILIMLTIAAGCTTLLANTNATTNVTPAPTEPVALYKVSVAQPEEYSRFIHMDTDIYNAGEVIEFVVTNDGKTNLRSPNDHPEYSVIFQTSHGSWATKLGPGQPVVSNASVLKPGESSKTYRFLSEGWEAGRYRIVSDYGVGRDFLIKSVPVLVQAPVCPPAGNATPWITIDPIPDHFAGEQFTISGTTNVARGHELRYTIFAPGSGTALIPLGAPVSIMAEEGTCGTSMWSTDVLLPEPGEYLIGIAEPTQKGSAIKRFLIRPAPGSSSIVQTQTPSISRIPVPPTPAI